MATVACPWIRSEIRWVAKVAVGSVYFSEMAKKCRKKTQKENKEKNGQITDRSTVSMIVRYLKSQHLHLAIEQIAKLVRFETNHCCFEKAKLIRITI